MALHLDRARQRVALLMDDACTITRHQKGMDDATLDTTTGKLTRATTDTTTVYDGPCIMQHGGATPNPRQTLGVEEALNSYTLHIPWDAPVIVMGDHVTITASADAQMVGHRYVVTGIVHTSFLVWRQIDVTVMERDRG